MTNPNAEYQEHLCNEFDKLDLFIKKNNLQCWNDGMGVFEEDGGTMVYKNDDYTVVVDIVKDDETGGDFYYLTISERFDSYETKEKTVKSLQTVKNNLKKYLR